MKYSNLPPAPVCKACGAAIRFIRTEAGRTMPVDEKAVFFMADEDGKDLFIRPDGTAARGTRTDDSVNADAYGYISHFATCTNPDFFRKARKKDRKKQEGEE